MVCLLNQISKIVPAMQNSLQFSTLKDKNVFLLHLHAGTYIFSICCNSLENLVALGMIISNKVL